MDNTTNSADGIVDSLLFTESAISSNPPPPKKKRKVPKKKMDVAEVVVHFSEERVEGLKDKLVARKNEVDAAQKTVKDAEKNLRTLENAHENLQQKYDELTQASRAELVDKYRKVVTLLKQHPMVNKFAVDRQKRIIITTNPVFVKKEDWKEAKNAGMFQIRIDFSADGVHDGIQILNITKRFTTYDSPTISRTSPCWGLVFKEDIERDFSTQDLYELVVDLIDYISSPHDGNGYTNWNSFFEKAEDLPKNYSFFKYDQECKLNDMEDITSEPNGTVQANQATIRGIRNLTTSVQDLRNAVIGPDNGAGTAQVSTWSYSTLDEASSSYRHYDSLMNRINENMSRSRISEDDYRILDGLREIGFNEQASYYLMRLIREDESDSMRFGNAKAQLLQLRLRGGGELELFVRFRGYRRLSENPINDSYYDPMTMTRETTMRYFANSRDLSSSRIRELESNGAFQFVLPESYWLTGIHERIERELHNDATNESLMTVARSPEEYREMRRNALQSRVDNLATQAQQAAPNGENSVVQTAEINFAEIRAEDIGGGPQIQVPDSV